MPCSWVSSQASSRKGFSRMSHLEAARCAQVRNLRCVFDSSLREGLARSGHARNSLQIICDCYVFPAVQETAYGFGDGAADLQDEIAAGLQRNARSGDQVFDDFEAGRSSEDSPARFEFADFELDLVFFRLADVGRIRDYDVEGGGFQAFQQIGVVEEEPALGFPGFRSAEFQLEAGGVGFGDLESRRGVVAGV